MGLQTRIYYPIPWIEMCRMSHWVYLARVNGCYSATLPQTPFVIANIHRIFLREETLADLLIKLPQHYVRALCDRSI